MSAYNKTKFYWLQLKEDFFDDDAIEWLENRPNGEKYSNFYLKLCLKSLKTNGILVKKIGSMLIPYDAEALRKLTGVKDIDTVKVAMDLLLKSGLVKVLENGEIYIQQLENLIGSKSIGAFKKQQQRALPKPQGGQLADICPPDIEIELELELEKDNNNNNKTQKILFGEYKRVKLTKIEYEKLCSEFGKDFIDNQIKLVDEYVESNNNKNKYSNFNLVIRKSIKDGWFTKRVPQRKENPVPDWFNKNVEITSISEEDKQELENLLKEFK